SAAILPNSRRRSACIPCGEQKPTPGIGRAQASMKKIRIGAGAGYAGDRIEPARELAERGDLDYLCFECLAERTVALAQKERLADARRGFAPRLAERMEAVLAPCRERGIRIVTNMGAANPMAALEAVVAVA